MAFWNNILDKIKSGLGGNTALEEDSPLINDSFIEKLEENLIKSDLGVNLALDFCDQLRQKITHQQIKETEVQNLLQEYLLKAFDNLDQEKFHYKVQNDCLNIILIVGVNGVGKTTSIGKLANKFKQEGHKVLIAAGDTFRAAAEEQLNIWAERAQVDILQLEEGAKSSTVVFKALERAQIEDHQILIIDTAGRLQNKANLMEELSKIKQVINKNAPENHNLETILVLDASTGSNAITQAEKFNEATELNSIFLSKYDGSARAGMVFSLAYNFKLPVKFVGTGESMTDIQEFKLEEFTAKYL